MSVTTRTVAPEITPILDRVEAALEYHRVPAEIWNNEAIFRAELDQVFGTCWVFVAHESEIPKAGDFVLRRIGLDPVIVTRDGRGGVNVLSNYCRHRGSQVCQTDTGNSRFFKCAYHGWTYSNNGDLVGTPHMREAYGERLDPKEWGLKSAPRVDVRSGFIFACLAQDGPSLEEYLGGAGWMLDVLVALAPGGMCVAGPPERYQVNADWKAGAENFSGDAYHVDTLHWSNEETHMAQGLAANCVVMHAYELGNGHGTIGMSWAKIGLPLWGYTPDMVARFDFSRLDDAQRYVLETNPPTIGNIFPNFSYIRVFSPTAPGGPPTVITSFRQWQPLAPGKMELWNWQFVWEFQTEQEKQDAYVTGQLLFGSAGTFEQDDTVAWEGAGRAAQSAWMQREELTFNFEQAGRTTVDTAPDPDYHGPGIKRPTGYGEYTQLNFYRHWLSVMRGQASNPAADAQVTA
ncbi:Rieske 2Fe-2S domain-containing protein [Mycolicibacterium sp. CBMA 226]|uniref:aromatic ring-hydroxylating oxygenase subunit alpha n=1 Tax=Mycolicibacterium sp. CBMA 226 TaxID=2606611 RepID=UPI0012DD3594|nr:Rieske 2Fe-2S domain-containing protein [Mycolicibacterium sp. CBMA 226]MUL78977.1 Rieske 2Fe-2S domain-containing protein [Mycolicibacterium sp. CBMA 226]QGW61288.1 Naphthalene 1,2-dioxygenase subunit alpha [Mycolicibacterium sp.]